VNNGKYKYSGSTIMRSDNKDLICERCVGKYNAKNSDIYI